MRRALARQRYLIDYTAAAMWRRKGRNLALMGVYTGLVFLAASVLLFGAAMKREAAFLLQGAPELVVQRVVAGRHDLMPAGYAERLSAIRGVRRVEARLWGYYFDPVVAANYTLMVPPDRTVAPGTVIIGDGIARARGAQVGDVISFRAHDGDLASLRVAAVLPHASAIVAADLMLLNAADYRALFGIAPGLATDLALVVANPGEVRKVAEKVLRLLPDTRPILREEMLRTYDAVFDWRQGLALLTLGGAGLAFAILAWNRAAGLGADERREIGILKALGWETGDVLRMKLWEGALVSFGAFLLGFALACWHLFSFGAPLFAPVLKGWAVLYPAFRLTPAVDGLELAGLFLLTVFPYLAATVVPVWRAAITDPDTVMR